MDAELQEINPPEVYLESVKAEISSYEEDEKAISDISVESSKEVEYKTRNGRECAYVDI